MSSPSPLLPLIFPLILILISCIYNILIKIKRWQKKWVWYLAWVPGILKAKLGSVWVSATRWLGSMSWRTHRFSHRYTCSEPQVTWTHAQPYSVTINLWSTVNLVKKSFSFCLSGGGGGGGGAFGCSRSNLDTLSITVWVEWSITILLCIKNGKTIITGKELSQHIQFWLSKNLKGHTDIVSPILLAQSHICHFLLASPASQASLQWGDNIWDEGSGQRCCLSELHVNHDQSVPWTKLEWYLGVH